jgi:hypothetical protein
MPARLPTAAQLSGEVYAAMQQQPNCAGTWVAARFTELVIYPSVCKEIGWRPRSWLGRDGVAN